jgi:alanine racemase
MLYGIALDGDGPRAAPLRPVLRALKSRLVEVKDIQPRERFATHAPFPVATPMRFGVIPLGAADGLGQLHAGRVLVRGRSAALLASPSLEHTRIDLSEAPEARVGDEVVVIGRQGGAEISPAEVAARHRLSPHQLAPLIGARVERVAMSGSG